MIFNYPRYADYPNFRTTFRRAVMHQILAQNNPYLSRRDRHYFWLGYYCAWLQRSKSTPYEVSVINDVRAEATRIFVNMPKACG